MHDHIMLAFRRVLYLCVLNEILALGEKGIDELHELQREALGDRSRHIAPKRTVVIASNNPHKIQEISRGYFADFSTIYPRVFHVFALPRGHSIKYQINLCRNTP